MATKDLRDRENPQFFDVWKLSWEKGNDNNPAKMFHNLDVRVMSEKKESFTPLGRPGEGGTGG